MATPNIPRRGGADMVRSGSSPARQELPVSHQGYEGWFPECINCGMGNLRGVVCLRPDHEPADLPPKEARGQLSELTQTDGHWWKLCLICSGRILSDPLSWGVYALCLSCAWTYRNAGRDWPKDADPKEPWLYPADHPRGFGLVRVEPPKRR